MADERDSFVPTQERARVFNNKAAWQRILIVVAGPATNFALAAFLYWVLFIYGVVGVKPYIAQPTAGSVAEKSGFTEFDLIVSIGDRPVQTWGDTRLALLEAAVKREVADVEVENQDGQHLRKKLNMEAVTKDELERDFLLKLGLLPYRILHESVIGSVSTGEAAERAGLQVGDRILAIEGKAIPHWDAMVEWVRANPAKPLEFKVQRRGQISLIAVTPAPAAENRMVIGRIGVGPQIDRELMGRLTTTIRYGPFDATLQAFSKVWEMSRFSLKMMGNMILGDISWKNLSGPITIADYAGQSVQQGWVSYIGFLALISISLGVLNLLPIPVLDGGQLMYYMAEIIKGSPVSERTIEIGQQFGLALLLGMTAFAFYNDIYRLVTG
ncbi:MAG: RIP metalloprotease RseP, partial [Betaproteobacteria bacterium]|nr:RIP metalloprotease RseP [Betaproteobacteria bacterium]